MDTNRLKNKLNIKDFIKGNSPGCIRLQSLRLPRDLSLGGTKPPKKIFKPNLNVVRNKSKKDTSRKTVRKHAAKNEKLRQGHKDRFVQSAGLFTGNRRESINIHHQEKGPSPREHVKPPTEIVPIIKKEFHLSDQKKEEIMFDNKITKNDNVTDETSNVETKLPFGPINWTISNLDFTEKAIKTETKSDLSNSKTLPEEYCETNSSGDAYPLTLWQLPDSLAFGSDSGIGNSQRLHDFKLSDMSEGKIGKISVRRSGKIDVHIGNTKYELEATKFKGFMEEVVALDVENPQKSTAMVLGEVQSRFLLNPDWDSLLQ